MSVVQSVLLEENISRTEPFFVLDSGTEQTQIMASLQVPGHNSDAPTSPPPLIALSSQPLCLDS